jgi:hypothetical protein
MGLTPSTATDRLTQLTQELLDAHCDTVCLAGERADGDAWAAHVEYLQALQRVAKRELAELSGRSPFSGFDERAATGAP